LYVNRVFFGRRRASDRERAIAALMDGKTSGFKKLACSDFGSDPSTERLSLMDAAALDSGIS
jgi:hypothetical protein